MSQALPSMLYRSAQVQQLDALAIESMTGDGFALMREAGHRAFALLQRRWPEQRSLTVLVGGGNNAGDGYVVASLAAQAGYQVSLYYLVEPDKLTGSAQQAYALLCQQDSDSGCYSVQAFDAKRSEFKGVVVDALLGIGIAGEVRDNYRQAIAAINAANLPVLALDVPSGVCADTGQVLGAAVVANTTITFIGVKRGLLTGKARNHVGELVFDSLNVAAQVYQQVPTNTQRINYSPPLLAARASDSHKGLYGQVLVLAGDHGFGGAGILAAEAALISGAGIVTLGTRNDHVSAALARCPELMVMGVEQGEQLQNLIEQASVLVVGPGLGRSDWSKHMLQSALATDLPMVLDADGLNLLASDFQQTVPRDNWLLTPHPAEAARLLGISNAEVQQDRFNAAQQLQQRYGGVAVLKGAGTVIADQHNLWVCNQGNSAMSAPGMGDVLSGVIGALVAQGIDLSEAAKLGVWAHASAGDRAAQQHGKHLLASDLYTSLRTLW